MSINIKSNEDDQIAGKIPTGHFTTISDKSANVAIKVVIL